MTICISHPTINDKAHKAKRKQGKAREAEAKAGQSVSEKICVPVIREHKSSIRVVAELWISNLALHASNVVLRLGSFFVDV